MTTRVAATLVALLAVTFLGVSGSALAGKAAAADEYVLSIALLGDGEGTITTDPWSDKIGRCGHTCMDRFDDGQTVTLTRDTDPGTTFWGWGEDANHCGKSVKCQITINKDTMVVAWFYDDDDGMMTIVTKTGNGSGTVKSNPAGLDCGAVCFARYPEGEAITLTAVPGPGSVFRGWEGACTGNGPTCLLHSSGMGEDVLLIRAVFDSEQGNQANLLFINKKGDGDGTVVSDPSGIRCGFDCVVEFGDGAEVTLTATPEVGSVFTGWDGACGVATGPVCRVTMNGARWVQASFAPEVPPATGPRFGRLKVTPKTVRAKPGKRAVFRARVKNTGGSSAKSVRICVKAPKKLVKVKRCVKIGSIAPGKTGTAIFRAKIRKRIKQTKLSFTVTGKSVAAKKARARLRTR